jgi:hypothetical protein
MITAKVEKLLQDFHPEHSEFQVQHFIVGTGGHPWERYKQALRELSTRHGGMIAMRAAIEAVKGDIAKAKRRWFGRGDVAGLEMKLVLMRKELKSKSREYCTFYKIARDLKKQIGNVTLQRRRELEAEMWQNKARRMAALDLISLGGLQRQTAEFIASLPREMRRAVLADLRPENRQRLLTSIE